MRHLMSSEAQAILSEAKSAVLDRSPENLPDLRKSSLTHYTPGVERVLKRTKVSVQAVEVAGTPCLEVLPPSSTTPVDWPILYGFGGGFVMGSPYEDLSMAGPIAARTGATVLIPNYRLAPEHPWPAAIDDGFAVYQALAAKPFAMIGESAGGNFALALMLRAQAQGIRLPSALALLSPWCDLSNAGDSLCANQGRDPTLAYENLNAAAAHYAGDNDISNPDISPINGDFAPHFPPTMITTGTRDLLQSQAVRLARVLNEAGVSVDLRVWEGLWHVFEFDDRLPEATQSLNQISYFLLERMKLSTDK
jgi:monoterpene epsilon-lactone hydrolase